MEYFLSMKKIILFSIISSFLLLSPLITKGQNTPDAGEDGSQSSELAMVNGPYSQAGSFELGGILGVPSGLNSRYWITDRYGLELSLGASPDRDFMFSLDFLFELIEMYRADDHSLRLYTGAGSLAGYISKDRYINLRVPLGLSMPFTSYPVTFSAYIAPAVVIKPESSLSANWGFAARYNFNIASRIAARNKQLGHDLYETNKRYDDITRQLDRTTGELDRAINELKKNKDELDTTKSELSTKKEEFEQAITKLTATRDELDDTKSRLTKTRESLDSASIELSEAAARLESTRKELSTTRTALDTVKNELDKTRHELNLAEKKLNTRESELQAKQAELEAARTFIKEALTGKQKQQEEEKLAARQKELDKEAEALRREREKWREKTEKQRIQRERLAEECAARGGIINEDGYCGCRKHEQWNSDKSKCVCVKGYRRNPSTGRCEPCDIVNYSGYCVKACGADEKRVALKKGPHKYVCVKRCTGSNEVWSAGKKECVCRDGFYRDKNGNCVPRR